MRASLAVFFIVTFQATTAVLQLDEFNADAEDELDRKVRGPERKTELINYSNVQILFRQQEVDLKDALHMGVVSVEGHPPRQRDDNPCGQWIGVKMDDGGKHFCRIDRFGVEMDYHTADPDLARMQLIVFFKCEGKQSILLEIPVLQKPTRKPRRPWPGQNKVGTLSPVSVEQLDNLHSSSELTIGFGWLSQLLEHGVRRGHMTRAVGMDQVDELYRTRPLLLRKSIIQKLMDEVEHFKIRPRNSPRNHPPVVYDQEYYDHLIERSGGK